VEARWRIAVLIYSEEKADVDNKTVSSCLRGALSSPETGVGEFVAEVQTINHSLKAPMAETSVVDYEVRAEAKALIDC
jgi:hypothetical protein